MIDQPSDAELRRRIRASRVFDAVLKRSWLDALPFMNRAQRAELAAILELERGALVHGDAAVR